jgi:hypothetical protein
MDFLHNLENAANAGMKMMDQVQQVQRQFEADTSPTAPARSVPSPITVRFADLSYPSVHIEALSLEICSATYGSSGTPADRDYTQEVRALVCGDVLHIEGNVHTVLGDPQPGVSKVFVVVYSSGTTSGSRDVQSGNISAEGLKSNEYAEVGIHLQRHP